MSEYILRTNNLYKKYVKNLALNNINLEIKRVIFMDLLDKMVLGKQHY